MIQSDGWANRTAARFGANSSPRPNGSSSRSPAGRADDLAPDPQQHPEAGRAEMRATCAIAVGWTRLAVAVGIHAREGPDRASAAVFVCRNCHTTKGLLVQNDRLAADTFSVGNLRPPVQIRALPASQPSRPCRATVTR